MLGSITLEERAKVVLGAEGRGLLIPASYYELLLKYFAKNQTCK